MTVRIDDDLLRDLKQRARAEGISLARLVNRALRQGMDSMGQATRPTPSYREKTFHMGEPKVDLDKALALSASLEDDARSGSGRR